MLRTLVFVRPDIAAESVLSRDNVHGRAATQGRTGRDTCGNMRGDAQILLGKERRITQCLALHTRLKISSLQFLRGSESSFVFLHSDTRTILAPLWRLWSDNILASTEMVSMPQQPQKLMVRKSTHFSMTQQSYDRELSNPVNPCLRTSVPFVDVWIALESTLVFVYSWPPCPPAA
eukprot:SAG31_NODE_1682_length_7537_cov_4.810164_7_plen_176_part_00